MIMTLPWSATESRESISFTLSGMVKSDMLNRKRIVPTCNESTKWGAGWLVYDGQWQWQWQMAWRPGGRVTGWRSALLPFCEYHSKILISVIILMFRGILRVAMILTS